MDFDLSDLIARSYSHPEYVRDPVTKSKGRVVKDFGPGLNRDGSPIRLVEVIVHEAEKHHKEADHVIWELPLEEESEP